MKKDLKDWLDEMSAQYNAPTFIESDPICVPRSFSRLQDIEITGFWTAILAWGQRKTIINSARAIVERMDGAPYDFIMGHEESDRKRFEDFYHRTFQAEDALYFLAFFQEYYRQHESLEDAFSRFLSPNTETIAPALRGFHELFFSLPYAPGRTRKHVPTPERKSTCKRLNMFLRWMVRRDENGVDFGLWKGIQPRQLLIPLDVHVERIARKTGLLQRKQSDWQAVLELTEALRAFDPEDPVKYDFALFGAALHQNQL
jgi:uncharacterized protein (TIGR02757 family)